jgi:hypothetical protein
MAAKSTGLNSSASARPAPTPKPAKNSAPKPAPNKVTPPPSSNTPPPSTNSTSNSVPPSSLSNNSSWSTNKEQSNSFSRTSTDGYTLSSETKSITTAGTTGLVDNLVKAFDGDGGLHSHSGSSKFSSSNSDGSSVYGTSSDGHQHGTDNCSQYSERAQERFEHLNMARDQLGTARGKVQQVLNDALEAKLNDSQEVPESVVKQAEKEELDLIKAEGKLDRTQGKLTSQQESMRQQKNEFFNQRQVAKEQLLNRLGKHAPAVRDDLMEKLSPMINKDAAARNNPQQLEEAAKWYMKSDSKTSRLLEQSQPDTSKSGMEDCQGGAEKTEKPAPAKSSLERTEAPKKISPQERRLKKRQKLEDNLRQKIAGNIFDEKVKSTDPSQRSSVVKNELRPLNRVSPRAAKEFEEKLNRKYTQAEKRESKSNSTELEGKSQERKQQTIGRLLEAKHNRAGAAGDSAEPLNKAIDDIDSESIRQTSKTLEHANLDSIHSMVDLERTFGRGVGQVRTDLEQQIGRSGKSTSKARITLKKLDKVIRRSKLMSSNDAWGALRQSIGSTGPNLNNFLGVPSGSNSGNTRRMAPSQPQRFEAEGRDTVSKSLLKRISQSGSRADDAVKLETLARLRQFGA